MIGAPSSRTFWQMVYSSLHCVHDVSMKRIAKVKNARLEIISKEQNPLLRNFPKWMLMRAKHYIIQDYYSKRPLLLPQLIWESSLLEGNSNLHILKDWCKKSTYRLLDRLETVCLINQEVIRQMLDIMDKLVYYNTTMPTEYEGLRTENKAIGYNTEQIKEILQMDAASLKMIRFLLEIMGGVEPKLIHDPLMEN